MLKTRLRGHESSNADSGIPLPSFLRKYPSPPLSRARSGAPARPHRPPPGTFSRKMVAPYQKRSEPHPSVEATELDGASTERFLTKEIAYSPEGVGERSKDY